MKHNYCTMFDGNYLAKGIAMIQSLRKHSPESLIHVFAMDAATWQAIDSYFDIQNGVAIYGMDLSRFEQSLGLDKIRPTRTHQEFCWSAGAIFTEYVANTWNIDLTYVDADCFFFSDPQVVFDEIGDKSIGITPHRFAKQDEARLLPNGKYAVQWVTFRGEVGRACLSKWAANVRRLCSYSHAEGQFADQKYLDFWERDYPGEVCEIQNIGAGVAPWNVNQYRVTDGPRVNGVPVILFHFHELRHDEDGNVTRLTGWNLPAGAEEFIYAPYSRAIRDAHAQTIQLRVDVG